MSFGPWQPNVSLTVSDPTTELSPARGGYSHTLPFENNKAYEGLAWGSKNDSKQSSVITDNERPN